MGSTLGSPYKVIEIEYKLTNDCSGRDILVNSMKLNKLLYLAYGWYMYFENKPLFSEPVIAVQYGPVVLETKERFESLGMNFINCGDVKWTSSRKEAKLLKQNRIIKDDLEFLREILSTYGKYSAYQLSSITHESDSAWRAAFDRYGCDRPIPDRIFRDCFEQYYKKRTEETEKNEE